MFAAPRPAELTLASARDGCSPAQLGTGEVMQAFATVQRGRRRPGRAHGWAFLPLIAAEGVVG